MGLRRYYVRPLPILGAGPPLREPSASDPFRSLCGRVDLPFAHVALIDRQASPQSAPQIVSLDELANMPLQFQAWTAEDSAAIGSVLTTLTKLRPDFAGLSMATPRIMGIVNLTPDSFSDGGRFSAPQAAIDLALRLVEEGADILDLGAESTRPGAQAISVDEELKRLMPVLEGVRSRTMAKISIDTRKSEVMARAHAAGADIWNDVSALTFDRRSLELAAEKNIPVILMHAQGIPETMNENPQYQNVTLDVFDFLETRLEECIKVGMEPSLLMIDPGIGFGKHLPHNVALLKDLSLFHGLGVPVLLGVSRKKLIGQLSNKEHPKERVSGSLAAALSAIANGVQIVRVHDVAETRQAVRVWQAIKSGFEYE